VSLTVNGQARTITVEPRMTLLDALREQLALTGTKKGCDRGECGACTVHIAMQEGKRITTIEGLERNGNLHPLQAAFIEHDGFQCGFCTPGQIMSALPLIEEAKAGWPSAATADLRSPFTLAQLSHAEIRERMSGWKSVNGIRRLPIGPCTITVASMLASDGRRVLSCMALAARLPLVLPPGVLSGVGSPNPRFRMSLMLASFARHRRR
jgi:xanthine dehydrogenase YagT iron-sulfur-binding subunit